MCIIAAKPAGVKMPDDETISRMWYRNQDGAGIMYAKDGKVRIDKGFMKLDDFKKHLKELSKTVDLDKTAVVMHFRITTHGGTSPENCHPFPITRSIKALQSLHQSAPIGIAHNGIIPITPRKGISDTMEYIATQLAPLYAMKPDFFKDSNGIELVKNAIQSKMAFLTADAEIYVIGDFVEDDGIMYSNTSYKPYEYTFGAYTGPYGGSWSTGSVYNSSLWDDDAVVEEIPLMWAAYLPAGSYFRSEDMEGLCDDLDDVLIDEEGRAYAYAWNAGVAYPTPEITVYDENGNPAKFDPDEAMLEPVGDTYALMDERLRTAKPKRKNRKKSKAKTAAAKASTAIAKAN